MCLPQVIKSFQNYRGVATTFYPTLVCLSTCTISSVPLIIVFDVAEWPPLSLCMALPPSLVKSGHHFHIYWMSITSAQYMATLCLWMLMGSMLCSHRNFIAVWNSSFTHSFSKVPISNSLHWHSISCSGEDTFPYQ
jgi:hypothetical protein